MLEAQGAGGAGRRLHRPDIFGTSNLNLGENTNGIVLNAIEHAAEHLEGFAFVLLFGVALRIATQMDALAQVIQRANVSLPMSI